jgi:hypothetical protein
MPALLLLLLLLTGCSSQSKVVESQLNSYAVGASRGSDLTQWLTGNALESARQSAKLVEELGLISYGSSSFSQTANIDQDLFESCLDLSGIQFRDSSGVLLVPPSPVRQRVEVSMQRDLVSNIELSGVPC